MIYQVLELVWDADEDSTADKIYEFSSEELAQQFIHDNVEWCKKECKDNNTYYKYEDDGIITTIDCPFERIGITWDRLWIDLE